MSDRITEYFKAKMEFELERHKFEADLLRRANAGEIYYDTSNMVTRCITDCDGNDMEISVGQWRETETQ